MCSPIVENPCGSQRECRSDRRRASRLLRGGASSLPRGKPERSVIRNGQSAHRIARIAGECPSGRCSSTGVGPALGISAIPCALRPLAPRLGRRVGPPVGALAGSAVRLRAPAGGHRRKMRKRGGRALRLGLLVVMRRGIIKIYVNSGGNKYLPAAQKPSRKQRAASRFGSITVPQCLPGWAGYTAQYGRPFSMRCLIRSLSAAALTLAPASPHSLSRSLVASCRWSNVVRLAAARVICQRSNGSRREPAALHRVDPAAKPRSSPDDAPTTAPRYPEGVLSCHDHHRPAGPPAKDARGVRRRREKGQKCGPPSGGQEPAFVVRRRFPAAEL